jgi:large subunit ribosomal protein L4
VASIKKYDFSGKEVGEVKIDDEWLKAPANMQMIKDYLVAIRNNQRQWSANTKTRAEVSHSGQKPHPQKGTGKARQGYLGAPQYKGGGRVFTPRPKFDQHVRINRKEKRAAIRSLLVDKIQNGGLHILQTPSLKAPKTKQVAEFLQKRSLESRRILFVGETPGAASEAYDNLILSLRNVPKLGFAHLPNVSGYDVARHQDIFIMEPAVNELMLILGGGNA